MASFAASRKASPLPFGDVGSGGTLGKELRGERSDSRWMPGRECMGRHVTVAVIRGAGQDAGQDVGQEVGGQEVGGQDVGPDAARQPHPDQHRRPCQVVR